ncbi:GGDEF domain-containing protein [Sulfoacidibacillus ferrooxidans]|uniref:GGDEF domain-containing protein n=1 Tax=Sulfoacidibacillus ferrooxidans TaxID=2005001 RepID=A0A9X2AE46_9BACL|nr:GGDEF domain-containing protein [Sulfoacidibacillus ferrooxidans]MCI0182786.1 hypothetical protein [Sulfoacidibacillus ferrooxidans]
MGNLLSYEQLTVLYHQQLIQMNRIDQIHKLMQNVSKRENVLQLLIAKMRELFLADIVTLIEWDGVNSHAHLEAHVGLFANRYPESNDLFSDLMGSISDFWTRPYVTWDVKSDFRTPIIKNYAVKNALFLPVHTRSGLPLGILSLYRCYDDLFSEDDISLLMDIAMRIGDELYARRIRNQELAHMRLLDILNPTVLRISARATYDASLFQEVQLALQEVFQTSTEVIDDPELFTQIIECTIIPCEELSHIPLCANNANRYMAVLRMSDELVRGYVLLRQLESFEVAILSIFWRHVGNLVANLTLQHRLQMLATLDMLTGLMNRYAFMETMTAWSEDEKRENEFISTCVFDVDGFKMINDTYGHRMGDRVLCHIVETAKSTITDSDMVFARYGGEEFILARRGDGDECKNTAIAILTALREKPFVIGEVSLILTVSMGIATMKIATSQAIHLLIQKADEAMYQAKRAGKDRLAVLESSDLGFSFYK